MKNEPTQSNLQETIHEMVFSSLDAYSTNELETDERRQVEQHLPICSRCQQFLSEIIAIKRQFEDHRTQNNYEQKIRKSTIKLADNVFRKISVNSKQEVKKQSIVKEPKMKKWIFALASLVVLCAIFLGFFVFRAHPSTPIEKSSVSVPSPQYWKFQRDQMTVKNSHIAFAIKTIDVTSREIRFFYAVHTRGKIVVNVFSVVPHQKKTTMHVQNQIVGQVDFYTVGVLHVERQNQANQVITLQVQDQSLSWTLAPLEQKIIDPSSTAETSFNLDQNQPSNVTLSDVTMNGPVISQDNQEVAFFKATPDHPSAGYKAQYVFLKMEYPSRVVLISQAQYIAIAGRQNFF